MSLKVLVQTTQSNYLSLWREEGDDKLLTHTKSQPFVVMQFNLIAIPTCGVLQQYSRSFPFSTLFS